MKKPWSSEARPGMSIATQVDRQKDLSAVAILFSDRISSDLGLMQGEKRAA